jgi:hypothetical protein
LEEKSTFRSRRTVIDIWLIYLSALNRAVGASRCATSVRHADYECKRRQQVSHPLNTFRMASPNVLARKSLPAVALALHKILPCSRPGRDVF